MVEITILYDYYGELLTDKQKMYFEDYYFSNLSLQEIAENNNVSRNAIHNSLKDIINKLKYYEDKLKLYEKGKEINAKLDGLKAFMEEFSNIDSKESKHLVLWEDYLIYSVMFDINKKIQEEYIKYFD